jgi:hypothetical protein
MNFGGMRRIIMVIQTKQRQTQPTMKLGITITQAMITIMNITLIQSIARLTKCQARVERRL